MFQKLSNQAGNPRGFLGKMILYSMNRGHSQLMKWGLSLLPLKDKISVLDIGCGGGLLIVHMLKAFPQSRVDGIDQSEESVSFITKRIEKFQDRSTILQGDVKNMPYPAETYDLVTAFETIYFWKDLEKAFLEVKRILKQKGIFLICCSASDPKDTKWSDRIEGMVIYEGEKLKEDLEKIGFQKTEIHKNKKGWMCVIAAREPGE